LLTNNVKDEFLRQWIIAWCAYPLQNVGAKMNSYLLVFGPSERGRICFSSLCTPSTGQTP